MEIEEVSRRPEYPINDLPGNWLTCCANRIV